MRIVVDMQCCQTAAANRGIGRYTLSLTKELLKVGKDHEFLLLFNGRLLPSSRSIVRELVSFKEQFVNFEGIVLGSEPSSRAARAQISDLLRTYRIETLSPDVYHISSIFEGESIFGEAVPYLSLPHKAVITSTVVFDFIPLLFEKQYIQHGPWRDWYNRTLSLSKYIDVNLAISEATKVDAQRFLGIPEERIVNILGDVDEIFRRLPSGTPRTGQISRELSGVPYILYVGGLDFRKNVMGTVEAFGQAIAALNKPYRLVLVLERDGDLTPRILQRAAELDISNRVIITGYMPDHELVELYNDCELFVFPSIYEGLGLPVIEAMRCGAPVLVGANSSLTELAPEPAYQFDATRAESIAAAIEHALASPETIAEMRRYSAARAGAFSWTQSATRTLAAWEDAVAKANRLKRASAHKTPKIAIFTPLPNEKTGIADYAADFLPALSQFANYEVFVDDAISVDPRVLDAPIRHHSEFGLRSQEFDVVVYQIGNSPFHMYMIPYMRKYPGIAVIHDAFLGHLLHNPARPMAFVRQAIADEGGNVRRLIKQSETKRQAILKIIDEFSCAREIVDLSIGVIVHSQFAKRALGNVANWESGVTIEVVQQYCKSVETARRIDRRQARAQLGVDEDAFVVASFGHIAGTKGIVELIEAFLQSRAREQGARLVLVGELEGWPTAPTVYADKVLKYVESNADISITGFVDRNVYESWLAATDVGVQLRTITRGETSRSILDLIGFGKPFIYNRLGPTGELPTDVGLRLDSLDVPALVGALNQMMQDRGARAELSGNIARFAAEALDAEAIAERFVNIAQEMSERARRLKPASLAKSIGGIIQQYYDGQPLADEAATAFLKQERSERPSRVYLDVTVQDPNAYLNVPALLRAAAFSKRRELRAQAVQLTSSGLEYADATALQCGALLAEEELREGPVALEAFDIVLMAGDLRAPREELEASLRSIVASGAMIVAVVDDCEPALSQALFSSRLADSAARNLDLLLTYASRVICISDYVAARLGEHVRKAENNRYAQVRIEALRWRAPVEAAAGQAQDGYFVCLGNLGADDAHVRLLQIFESLWSSGSPVKLVFLAEPGWHASEALEALRRHPKFGDSLNLQTPAPDAQRYALIGAACGVIALSASESESAWRALDIAKRSNTPIMAAPELLSESFFGRSLADVESVVIYEVDEPQRACADIEMLYWSWRNAERSRPDLRAEEELEGALLEAVLGMV